MKDIEKTIHYTTKAEIVCANLCKYIPKNAILVEPFVGDGDLLRLFPNNIWEKYDIQNKGINIIQDTLSNPPSYKNKWVITNPPYLAKNKTTEKSIFEKYNTDDLYKAALLSLLDCEGGILIIPMNFFTDERTGKVRKLFLDQFKINEINFFTQPIFNSTTYSVCSFAFTRKSLSKEKQHILINIFPNNQISMVDLFPDFDYQLGGDFYNSLNKVKNIFGRLVKEKSEDYITDIKLYGLDTRTERIRVEIDKDHYIGKNTDRIYATFTCKRELTQEQQVVLVEEFNKQLEAFRSKYLDLCLTNYRDFNRKRIGFTFAYQLMSKIYYELF